MDWNLLTLGSSQIFRTVGLNRLEGLAQMTDWIAGSRALIAHRCSLQVLGDVNDPQRHAVLTN